MIVKSVVNGRGVGMRPVGVRLSMVAFLATALLGTQALARPLDPISAEEMESRLRELNHLPWLGQAVPSNESWSWTSGCYKSTLEIEVIDPVTAELRKMTLSVRRPDTKDKVPVMVILPTIEGTTPLEPEMGSQLCGANIASVIAEVSDNSIPEQLPSWGMEDRRNRETVITVRSLLDYLETDPRFDKEKMGVIGLSQGAISASLMAGIEPDRLKAVVIAVGGGNVPYILAQSTNGDVSELRQKRMDYLNLTDVDQYEEEVRKTVKYDPIYFAPRVKAERTMMVMAEGDTKVPYIAQQEEFGAFGAPSSMIFSGGHVPTLIALTYWYFGDVISFIQSRVQMDPSQLKHHRLHRKIQLPESMPESIPTNFLKE